MTSVLFDNIGELTTCALDQASGAQVQPAAALPLIAKRAGAGLAILNREPTPLDSQAELIICQPIGAALSALCAQTVN